MAKNTGANRTDGANGPRDDESKENTVSGQAHAGLLATFDEVDFTAMDAPLGISSLNPQERHGSGAVRSAVNHYGGPNEGANDSPNMFSQGFDISPNDAGNASLDGADDFENPRNLPHINPRDGYSNCWIRWFEASGEIDRDLQRMIKRGYTPVDPKAVPPTTARFLQKRKGFDGADMLSVSGMVLCEIPSARLARLTEAEKQQHRRNEQATLSSAQDANKDAARRGSGMQIGLDAADR